jgi:uncharacterized protein (UPF0335 family)
MDLTHSAIRVRRAPEQERTAIKRCAGENGDSHLQLKGSVFKCKYMDQCLHDKKPKRSEMTEQDRIATISPQSCNSMPADSVELQIID